VPLIDTLAGRVLVLPPARYDYRYTRTHTHTHTHTHIRHHPTHDRVRVTPLPLPSQNVTRPVQDQTLRLARAVPPCWVRERPASTVPREVLLLPEHKKTQKRVVALPPFAPVCIYCIRLGCHPRAVGFPPSFPALPAQMLAAQQPVHVARFERGNPDPLETSVTSHIPPSVDRTYNATITRKKHRSFVVVLDATHTRAHRLPSFSPISRRQRQSVSYHVN
jgi:hypothetical protein